MNRDIMSIMLILPMNKKMSLHIQPAHTQTRAHTQTHTDTYTHMHLQISSQSNILWNVRDRTVLTSAPCGRRPSSHTWAQLWSPWRVSWSPHCLFWNLKLSTWARHRLPHPLLWLHWSPHTCSRSSFQYHWASVRWSGTFSLHFPTQELNCHHGKMGL